MTKTITSPCDPADRLQTEEDRAAYLAAALEVGNQSLVAAAIGDVVHAIRNSEQVRHFPKVDAPSRWQ